MSYITGYRTQVIGIGPSNKPRTDSGQSNQSAMQADKQLFFFFNFLSLPAALYPLILYTTADIQTPSPWLHSLDPADYRLGTDLIVGPLRSVLEHRVNVYCAFVETVINTRDCVSQGSFP